MGGTHPVVAGAAVSPQTAAAPAGAASALWFPLVGDSGDSAGTEHRGHPWDGLRAPQPLLHHSAADPMKPGWVSFGDPESGVGPPGQQ